MLAIVNVESGSVPENAQETLTAILDEADCDYELLICGSDDIVEASERARDLPAEETVLVWGGDGSVACVLKHCHPDGPAVLPLPGGTMNLLHRKIHGDACDDWRALLGTTLRAGKRCVLPAGEIGEHRFFVGFFLGNLSHLSEPREALRKGELVEAAREMLSSDALDFVPRLIVEAPNVGPLERTITVGGFLKSGDGSSPLFDVGLFDPESNWDLARAAFSAIVDDWHNADRINAFQSPTLTVSDFEGHSIRATLDGEPIDLPSQCSLRVLPKAASVMRLSA